MNHNFHKILTLEPLRAQFLIDGEFVWRTEEFEDIPDYEGYYQVSTFGRVKSLERKVWNGKGWRVLRGRIMKPSDNGGGYHKISLPDRKTFKVSTLVAIVFLNHKPDGTHKIVVDHKDNIRTHDYRSNLQLITNRENASKDRFRENYLSKYVGVSKNEPHTSKWRSKILINGKSKHLGYFVNELDAHNAYKEAKEELEELVPTK